MMRLTLPYPPSVNRYWRVAKNGRVYKSAEAEAYAWEVLAAAGGRREPLDGDIAIDIAVYRPRKVGDLDNINKALLDSLEGIAYHDDKQIVELYARRFDDKDNPRVEVTVRSLAG